MIQKMFMLIIWALLLNGCSSLVVGTSEITGMSLFHDRRTMENVSQDVQIEAQVQLKLSNDDLIDKFCHFNITVFNGLVLITGEVLSQGMQNKISTMAKAINGVRFVRNHLKIAPISSLSNRTNDSFLTAQVKLTFSQSKDMPGLDATRIKVVTENAEVFLMGLVHPKEANIATEHARRVEGVKKVIKVFEFL
jgi:osmotically-inducible protein OsmY